MQSSEIIDLISISAIGFERPEIGSGGLCVSMAPKASSHSLRDLKEPELPETSCERLEAGCEGPRQAMRGQRQAVVSQ